MEKKNDKTVQSNEMMELTLDQMDKVSGGGGPQIFSTDYNPDYETEPAELPVHDPLDRPDIHRVITMD